MRNRLRCAWNLRLRWACHLIVLCGVIHNSCFAQQPTPSVPTPEQDDATLRDVHFVGQSLVFAVGDRGVVWKSIDGGLSWNFISTPTTATLESVCFLTDQIGWIAGGDVLPGSQQPVGVLLATSDGGETWSDVSSIALPYIMSMRFFDLESGVVCGPSTWNCPTGVMSTTDGGQTWTTVDGAASAGWRSGAFINRDHGVLGGRRGANTVLGNGRVLPDRSALGLRTVHDCTAHSSGRCWMVGDGGLLRRSDNLGASWSPPDQRLPREWEQQTDLLGVTASNDRVWCVGRPGRVVWHSPDAGATWERQPTTDDTPLEAIAVATSADGDGVRACAVGSMGRIVISHNGRDWQTVRGGERRVSVLAIHAYPHRISLPMIARHGLEDGFRTAAIVPIRKDAGPTLESNRDDDLTLQQSIIAAGGNDAATGWELSLSVPGIESDRQALINEWTLQTDGKFATTLLSRLVADIRMWKPDVIVYEQPVLDDATTTLLHEAVQIAVAQAADADRFPEHAGLGLLPWQVSRIVARLPSGQQGAFQIDQLEPLSRQRTTLRVACEPARSRLIPEMLLARVEQYVTEFPVDGADGRSLFAGLSITPGSPSRRMLRPLTEFDDQLFESATQQRNFAGYLEQMTADPARASQVVGQLRNIVAPLSREAAAIQLQDVAREFAHQQHWNLVEDVNAFLVEQYPDQPAAREAMTWLLLRWSSEEVAWQRLRQVGSSTRQMRTDRDIVQGLATQPVGDPGAGDVTPVIGESPSYINFTEGRSSVSVHGADLHNAEREYWRRRARLVSNAMQELAPEIHTLPETQLALASLHSRQGAPGRGNYDSRVDPQSIRQRCVATCRTGRVVGERDSSHFARPRGRLRVHSIGTFPGRRP